MRYFSSVALRRLVLLLVPAALPLLAQAQAPTVGTPSPGSGAQGSTFTLSGTVLTATRSVRLGGQPAAFVVNSSTRLTVTVPRGASTHKVSVSTPGGTVLSAAAFGVDKANSYSFPLVTANFSGLDVGTDSAPTVTDIDGDGLLDLLVGKTDGTLNRYEQPAANATTFALVTANFNGIDVGDFSTPAVTDIDGDGLLDLLVGEYDGNLNRYEQTAPNSTSFALVTASFNGIDVVTYAAPAVTDLDGDGLLDLLVGRADGTISHYEQTAANGGTFTLVTASFNSIDVGEYSTPTVVDLDGDGLLDMLVGEGYGKLSHYEQTAANATTFVLVTASFSAINVGFNAAPTVTDLDGDGRLDLLVGKTDGSLNHYEQALPVPTITSLSPGNGSQGSTFTLTGTNLGGYLSTATSVRLGGQPAAFAVNSATQLTVTVPPGASTHRVSVSTPGGTALSTAAFGVDKANSYNFPLVTNSFNGINVSAYSAPTFTDLDGDGLLDMLVGKNAGTISHYEQTAANALTFALVTASFNGIDVGVESIPTVTDLDGDGLLDMLVGEYDGTLKHYEQTAANATTFALVTTSFSGIDVGGQSAPAVTDLDGDGLLDLLVGEYDGNVNHYEQTVANGGTFALVTDSFNSIGVTRNSTLTVADLDGDGLLNLLVGKFDGSMAHYEQTAANSLTFAQVASNFNGIDVGSNAKPTLTDLDGDGLLDMVVGELDGTLNHYEQAAPVPTITGLAPGSGPQGSTFTLTGTNLSGYLSTATSVRLGGQPAAFAVNSATQLTVTVPPGASTHRVSVSTPGGLALSTAAFGVDKANSYNFPLVTAGFSGITAGTYSAPTVTDLDGDGLLDLLVGKLDGTLSHYEQTAANAPTFGLVTNTFNSIDVGFYSAPTFTDLDGDGLLDLLVGKLDGSMAHYEQTVANGGTFALATASFNTIDVGDRSAPTLTDLDGDGLLDLLVGKYSGQVSHYEQTVANGGTFALVTASFGGISVSTNSTLTVADLDGDGLLDMLVGRYDGSIVHSEQTAANGLTFALVTTFFNSIGVGNLSAPTLTDLDGDGLLDLLVGEQDGTLNHYEQAPPVPTITGLAPGSGPQGSTFVLTGTNLSGYLSTATSVRLGGQPAAFAVNSATQLTVTVPPGSSTHKVSVSTPSGTALSAAAFGVLKANSYNFPLVTNSFNSTSVGSLSVPAFTDLDGDGLLDLLVGRSTGTLVHYEQTAANVTTFTLVTASFNGIDVGSYAAPTFTDLDGDGLLDLLVGNDAGTLSHYEQTVANGLTFALVAASFNSIDVGDTSNPTVTDLDGDGLLDLLVGKLDGSISHYEQMAANGPTFALVTASFNTIDVGNNSAPTLTDLDGDGLLDMLVGKRDGTLSHYEQTAANGLSFALVTAGFNGIYVGFYAAPTLTDLDGDGLLDLLVGENDGNLNHYEQAAPVPTITGLAPGSGPQGSTFTVTGTNLGGYLSTTRSVRLGGQPAAFVVNSATQLTVTVPRGSSTHKVSVSTPGGTALSTAAFGVDKANSYVFPLVSAGFNTIDVGSLSAPTVADLDGDGLLDMLVGTLDGTISHYEQTAANGLAFGLVTASFNSIDVGTDAAPTFTDLDGDGLLDMLVGRGDGAISHYEQTAANAPTFGLLTNTFNSLNVGNYANPTVTDLDGDGLLDLLVGKLDGTLSHYEQTAANGLAFGLVTASFNGLDVGIDSAPTVTDLDGDGLLDMLVGKLDGAIGHYEQTAANGLTFALVTASFNGLDVGSESAPTLTDLDGDGLLDMLVGTLDGNLNHYEQVPRPTLTALSTAAELPGQAVVLTGTGFTSGSTVSFGGVAASSVTFTSPTSLTAVVPVGAAAGSSAIVVANAGVGSLSSPAFEVLQVYRSAAASGCLSTEPLTLSGTGGAGAWRYLRLPAGQGGAVVAAIEDTRNLGTVTAGVLALGTGTTAAVRRDGRASRAYLDRNFYLTATNASFPGQTVRVRFFGLSSELSRLSAADANATLATLNASQYDGTNVNCTLTDNDPAGQRRLLPAPATVLSGTDWFTAQVSVTDHFSEFYLTGASSPLPVELSTFTAAAEGPAARLRWATASEQHSARFDIERSPDGKQFEKIGEVKAQGSTARPTAYTFLDSTIPLTHHSTTYYRLRQVDVDGTASYSPVRVVAGPTPAAALSLTPNPTRSATTAAGLPAGAPVQVLDALGRVLLTATADASGTARLALPSGLAAGVYVVRSGSQARRLVVE
ncbi:FG-GAP-like repeat-containing protein [Hymenobacter sp. ASUV-10]|uniref:FG-GAP-like repeat-containing protein n=1 Tax=Hymenobacter aranciens TaxID=3063996 RepID=A0ABT9BFX0_9BACT|nr:FG-GAP-like repeat-containing protein [Hymenobacter sp. ASUV-10]MDO7877155.1 FG-GAP-like repeat-containing protein [Hymenobacter sp. ASUV-10]